MWERIRRPAKRSEALAEVGEGCWRHHLSLKYNINIRSLRANFHRPKTTRIMDLVPPRIHCQAWQRGGAGDRLERTTQNLLPGACEKRSPLRRCLKKHDWPRTCLGGTHLSIGPALAPGARWRSRVFKFAGKNHRNGARDAPYKQTKRGTSCAPADPVRDPLEPMHPPGG